MAGLTGIILPMVSGSPKIFQLGVNTSFLGGSLTQHDTLPIGRFDHRNLSPQEIFISETGILIMDFNTIFLLQKNGMLILEQRMQTKLT